MTTIVLDIETVPSPEALAREAPEEYLMTGVASTWGAEAIEKNRTKRAEKWASEAPKIAALDWRLGQICAVGIVCPSRSSGMVLTTESHTEADLLGNLWGYFQRDDRLAGFCIRSFDLPYLLGRSAMLGVPVPRRWNTNRYDHRDIVDLADLLSTYGTFATAGWTLDRYSEAFHLPTPGYGSGADVYSWYLEGQWNEITKHLASDLARTAELYDRVAQAFGVAVDDARPMMRA